MTQTSWPFEGVDTTETQYSRLLRNIGQGVNGVPGDNNLLAYADSSGMNVKVKVSGGNSQAVVRGHMYQSTSEETLTITASAAQPRIDAVVLRLDPSANSIVLAVVAGTPASSPSAPSLTQTDTAVYELLIAHVTVPGSATTISAGNVTDRRTFIENVWTTANRKPAFLGLTGYNTTIGKLETYNGSTWEVVTPTSLDASVISSGTIDSARLANVGTSGTYTKVTTDSKGRISSGTTLSAADIPALDSTKITTGGFDASRITGGTLDGGRIPPLDSSSIVSGVLNAARIPNLDGSKITSGNITNIFCVDTAANGFVDTGLVRLKNGVGGYGITLTGSNGNSAFGGAMTVAGTLNVSSGFGVAGNIYAGATYNQNNSGRAVFVAADGLLGVGGSSERFKNDIADANLDVDAVREIAVRTFVYKPEFGDGSTQIGVIAEELVELGLTQFVYFDEDGTPDGVAYEKLALAALALAQHNADRLDAIEAKLDGLI